ncbi:MAG: aminotransferase class III-fold pyridoxal phosphate-dependent enzyme [Robiginitomaculum sp.]|nr:aminotransferase class III-fold pyridoxal phosphate-dependent enzyme [Robiginitomaculum sp.]MDQ7076758.1 aminotransferase class III-fold pyridoxal phosphate-dependent enzyme [Robiginitomaculum sp.]
MPEDHDEDTMPFPATPSLSPKKEKVLRDVYDHLYPGRVTRLLEGGIAFVPDRREGYRYWDMDGHEVFDLHLNGGTFNLGHRNPDLVAVLQDAMNHYDIGNHHFPSKPKADLANALIAAVPGDMRYVVLTASGSEANDVAIKSARFATKRRKIVALDAGYHGRTGLSGAAGDDETAQFFNSHYPDEFIKVPFNDLNAMENALSARDVALVMMEPIPATCGFPLPEDDYLPGVKRLCEQYGTLFLADEVQTGLGRTGYAWAVEAWGVKPDMLVTGKGLSGGLYPIAAVVMSEKCGAWLTSNGWGHVSTFGGSDLGCVVAQKALAMSIAPQTLENVNRQAAYIRDGLERIKPRFPFFTAIRQKGLVMGLQFADSTMAYGMMRALYENGIWAIAAGFDETTLQFKPGLLVDQTFCDELLARFENACIWLVNNLGDLITGGTPDADDPEIIAARALAQKALKNWGLENADITLLKHRENTVFKITAKDGTRYALRVHRHGYHSDAALKSELLWMQALQQDGIDTPAVIPTKEGDLFVTTSHEAVATPRQCSLLSWVEGVPFDDLGRVEKGMQAELVERYHRLGALAAQLHNQAQDWTPPEGFTRQKWDEEGLLGDEPLWGRFWEHPVLSARQKDQILKARLVLQDLLAQIGKDPAHYGLIHADFLPENILVHKGDLYLIDFDDSGYGWHLFEMATSLFPQADQPFFDDLVAAYVAGYRQHRTLSDEHVELLPAFIMIRAFTYLGWLKSRQGSMKNADRIAQKLGEVLEEYIPELMAELTRPQRLGVEVLHFMAKLKTSMAGR